jgi:hypothetical protein
MAFPMQLEGIEKIRNAAKTILKWLPFIRPFVGGNGGGDGS